MMMTLIYCVAAAALAIASPRDAVQCDTSSIAIAAPIPAGGTIAVQALTRRGRPMCFGEARLFQNGVCVRGPKLTDGRGRVWFHNLPAGHFEIRLLNYVTCRRGSSTVYLHNLQAMWATVQVR